MDGLRGAFDPRRTSEVPKVGASVRFWPIADTRPRSVGSVPLSDRFRPKADIWEHLLNSDYPGASSMEDFAVMVLWITSLLLPALIFLAADRFKSLLATATVALIAIGIGWAFMLAY